MFIFRCNNNLLTSLDLRNGTNESVPNNNFIFSNNPSLTCINVDNATYSTNTWTSFLDPQMFFSENCSLGFDKFESSNFKIYPVPASNEITIDAKTNVIESITLFDITGKEINTFSVDSSIIKIDVSNYAKGTYIFQVKSDKGILNRKIIIN